MNFGNNNIKKYEKQENYSKEANEITFYNHFRRIQKLESFYERTDIQLQHFDGRRLLTEKFLLTLGKTLFTETKKQVNLSKTLKELERTMKKDDLAVIRNIREAEKVANFNFNYLEQELIRLEQEMIEESNILKEDLMLRERNLILFEENSKKYEEKRKMQEEELKIYIQETDKLLFSLQESVQESQN